MPSKVRKSCVKIIAEIDNRVGLWCGEESISKRVACDKRVSMIFQFQNCVLHYLISWFFLINRSFRVVSLVCFFMRLALSKFWLCPLHQLFSFFLCVRWQVFALCTDLSATYFLLIAKCLTHHFWWLVVFLRFENVLKAVLLFLCFSFLWGYFIYDCSGIIITPVKKYFKIFEKYT